MTERERPETVPVDPEGPDPEGIPDPMPADLQREPGDDRPDGDDAMDGEAPTG